FLSRLPPHHSTLFPYTTLFRSFADALQHALHFVRGFCGAAQTVWAGRSLRRRARGMFGQTFDSQTVAEESGTAAGHVVRWFISQDRKSTRLNSSHVAISYAVFC